MFVILYAPLSCQGAWWHREVEQQRKETIDSYSIGNVNLISFFWKSPLLISSQKIRVCGTIGCVFEA